MNSGDKYLLLALAIGACILAYGCGLTVSQVEAQAKCADHCEPYAVLQPNPCICMEAP